MSAGFSVGWDGRVYLSGMVQNPNAHFPTPFTVCLDDIIEKAVERALEKRNPTPEGAGLRTEALSSQAESTGAVATTTRRTGSSER